MLKKLPNTKETHLFIFGIILGLIYIIWMAILLLFNPEIFQTFVGITATNILFGRAAGMSFGYTMELGHILVISSAMLIETILVLIFYPLFVLSWKQLITLKKLKKIMEHATKIAEANQEKIQKYGILGLFMFVWIPFWMTGPVTGCIIGFLLGLRPLINLSTVLCGTYIAIICWALFLKELHAQIAKYSPYAPMTLLILIIIIAIIGNFINRKSAKKRNRLTNPTKK